MPPYRKMARKSGRGVKSQLKSKLKKWLSSAGSFAKKKKLISRIAKANGFSRVGMTADMMGYGKRTDRAMGLVKKHKLISRGLSMMPATKKYAGIARSMGYGQCGKGVRMAGNGTRMAGNGTRMAGNGCRK